MRPTQGESSSPSLWFNLVCLDAPLVAVAWQALFAQTLGATISAAARAALFLTAWLIYLTDRFVDATSVKGCPTRSLRQAFCLHHRRAWLASAAAIAVVDGLAVLRLDRPTVTAGTMVGLAALLYLVANSATRIWRFVPLKEVSIGTLFAFGTVLVPLLRGHQPIALEVVAFAAVCALNCICIAVWERRLDESQRKVTVATTWREVERFAAPVCITLGVICALSVILREGTRPLLAAIAASAMLLGAIDIFKARFNPDVRTALADLVLLTPIAALFWKAG